jgi:hypothetical protein
MGHEGSRLMIGFVVAAMLAGAGADLRHDFSDCLKQASAQARNQKVGIDGFVAFVRSNCATAESPFQASLVSANVSHGMSKKAAANDAASQIDDYYSERLDNYKGEMEAETPPSAAASPH